MIFTEFRFFLFALPVLGLYWLLRSNRQRSWLLLAASYYFYCCWDWRFLSLVLISTTVCYVAGERIYHGRNQGERRFWLIVSLVVNLGLLCFFKYFNFFVDSFVQFAAAIRLPVNAPTLKIILPVGISFFTFQALSYTIEIYYKNLQPTGSFLKFAVFKAFFPQLVAGPIVRAADFLPQLEEPRTREHVDLRWALVLFLMGFIKKACISDNISPFVDAYFQNPSHYNGMSAWLAMLLYAAQIYCDFSGYTDMAIATAGLFGYQLTRNFNAPYLAQSVTDFWHRWHISLSSWLRDYLYIPLGGNRYGKLNTHRNILLTMLLGGLWHGASWNFVLWGFMHGIALSLHKLWLDNVGRKARKGLVGATVCWALTMLWVCLAWIPFRAVDFRTSLEVLSAMFGRLVGAGAATGRTLPPGLWIILVVLFIAHWTIQRGGFGGWWRRPSAPAFFAMYGAAWSLVLACKATGVVPFIYFQF